MKEIRILPTPPLPKFGTATFTTKHVALDYVQTHAFGFVWITFLQDVLDAVKRSARKNKINTNG